MKELRLEVDEVDDSGLPRRLDTVRQSFLGHFVFFVTVFFPVPSLLLLEKLMFVA